MRTVQFRVMAVFLLVTVAMLLAGGEKAQAQSQVWTSIQRDEPSLRNSFTAPSVRHFELRIREKHPEGVEEYHFLPFESPETPVPGNWC